jgi:hypothetical protein
MVHFLLFFVFALSCSTSSAAPAAGSTASGPAPGWGRPGLPLRASPLLLAASLPALLISRVCVAALIVRQLAGQPEWRRHGLGRRRRRRLHRFGRLGGGRPHRYHRLQPRTFVGWLGGLAADDVGHHHVIPLAEWFHYSLFKSVLLTLIEMAQTDHQC